MQGSSAATTANITPFIVALLRGRVFPASLSPARPIIHCEFCIQHLYTLAALPNEVSSIQRSERCYCFTLNRSIYYTTNLSSLARYVLHYQVGFVSGLTLLGPLSLGASCLPRFQVIRRKFLRYLLLIFFSIQNFPQYYSVPALTTQGIFVTRLRPRWQTWFCVCPHLQHPPAGTNEYGNISFTSPTTTLQVWQICSLIT